jgi:hypothetical protein
MEKFSELINALSVHGDKALDVFKGLAGASKSLGVEANKLHSIFGDNYDTFDQTAEIAGKLNTLFGRDLFNSIELFNATEEERIRITLRNFEATGRSWESMGRWEKRAVAMAAKINDLSEANKIFRGSLNCRHFAQLSFEKLLNFFISND